MTLSLSHSVHGAAGDSGRAAFTLAELRRVGTAATMIVIGGTVVIVVMMMAMGHYNSLSHALPKAVLDGAVIALLIGQRGRWRCLGLLGMVYGLVLVLYPGVPYLLPVMAVAGAAGALTGRLTSVIHRGLAVMAAAVVFELLAGFGAPIKIYFGTGGESEPFIWGMWFLEWPLRIVGALAGVGLSARLAHWAEQSADVRDPRRSVRVATKARPRRVARGRWAAGVRLAVSVAACILPMLTDSWALLGGMAAAAVIYGLIVGLRWRIFHALIGLLWGWLVLALLSYLYHQETARGVEMLRTFALRFMPLTIASVALVTTARPVDIIRVLRAMRLSRIILLPLTDVVRAIPRSRHDLHLGIERLRQQGTWKGPWSMLRHPVATFRVLLAAPLRRWTRDLRGQGELHERGSK